MPFFHEKLAGWTSVQDTFAAFFANQPGCFWLDREHNPLNPFTVMGAGVKVSNPLFRAAEESVQELPFSFLPHLVGVLDYREAESDPLSGEFLAVDRAFVFDHQNRWMYFVGRFETKSDFEAWFHAALLRLALIGGDAAAYQLNNAAATASNLVSETPKSSYLDRIDLAKRAISLGEVYQLCLTTRIRGAYSGDPLSYFLRLRKSNPAPYAAFIRVAGKSFVSISPEQSVSVAGKSVTSSPIKGTRARSEDLEADLQVLHELASDPKERAENLMIVDLIRNDLSRVCDPESVSVDELLAVKTYSTLHQLVSSVSGTLRSHADGFAALDALSPGGSMTGAPKKRAMELILELEDSPRGSYSGGIGWIGPNGDMDLGMVIRTAIFEAGEVSIGVGGGITSDSNPEAEHEEIILKAKALVMALGSKVRW